MQLTGALTVCISSVLLGLLLCKEEKKHVASFEEILFLMRCIRDEIWIRRTPTEVIFSSLSSPYLENAGFYTALTKEKNFYTASLTCGFTQNELGLIKDFSEKIGKSDAENQKSEFDYIISKAEEHLKNLHGEMPKRQKLNVTLPVFFGLLFVVVFF